MASMKKNIVYTIIIIFGSFLIAGVFVELFMRIVYEPMPAFNLNEIKDSFDSYEYTPQINNLGFREEEPDDKILGDSTTRILFLGDSFTHGTGVSNGSDRFSDIIESRLNDKTNKHYSAFHVYNAGVKGTEPRRWVGYLKELLPLYRPHSVVVIFFLRDGTDLCTSLMCYKDKIARIKAKYENNFIYKFSYLGKFIVHKVEKRAFANFYLSRMKNSYLGNETEKQTWYEQQGHLLEMQKICADNNIDFHLVIFPMLFGLEGNYQFHDVEEEINRFARAHQMPLFSLTPGFIGLESKSLWVSPSDQHPNEKGHQVAADILFPYIDEILTR